MFHGLSLMAVSFFFSPCAYVVQRQAKTFFPADPTQPRAAAAASNAAAAPPMPPPWYK